MRNALLCLILFSSSVSADLIGRWYDDVGSPDYLDAKISINKKGSKYFYHRTNGDGSQGSFLLIRSGSIYKRADGKFGSVYVVTPKGLEMYDTSGYIRTARPN